MAMLRIWERAEDRDAPTVPEDSENAAVKECMRDYWGRSHNCIRYTMAELNSQEVFLPRLGPDNCTWISAREGTKAKRDAPQGLSHRGTSCGEQY
jgi:hypothetical protein